MNLEKAVYITSEVQEILQLGKGAVGCLLRSGRLKSVRYGRKWLIPREAILEFLGTAGNTHNTGGTQ
jgi:excisionase family DNA binding protein